MSLLLVYHFPASLVPIILGFLLTIFQAVNDKADVMKYLSPLSKQEIKTLGMLLGLYNATVMNAFGGTPIKDYLDNILTAWFNEQDGVTEKGKFAVSCRVLLVIILVMQVLLVGMCWSIP